MSDMQKQTEAGAGAAAESGSLIDQILNETRLKPQDEGYATARRGVEAFIAEMLAPNRRDQKVEQRLIDQMISEIDQKLSRQVDEILHDPGFQKLESAWRGLKMAVDRTDFRENIKIEMLNVSKEDLLEDFEDAPEVTKSGLYKHIYSAEYGQFGGQPYGMIIGNYSFGPGAQDIKLMQQLASVGAMSHAPVIAAAGPEFFGADKFDGLPNLKDLDAILEGPQFAKWQAFRESEDARHIGLTMPRFMLRLPYGEENPSREFNYQQDVSASREHFVWGSVAYAFATRLTESVAK